MLFYLALFTVFVIFLLPVSDVIAIEHGEKWHSKMIAVLIILALFAGIMLGCDKADGAEFIGKTTTPRRSIYAFPSYPVVVLSQPCPRPVRVFAPPVKPSAAVLKAASGVSYNPDYVEPPYSPPVMIYNPYVKQ